MSSQSYFPKPVKAVAIPKKNGGWENQKQLHMLCEQKVCKELQRQNQNVRNP